MDFERVVRSRHSVRNFKSQEVSETLLRKIVETAELTPSWENSQPWKVYIATGQSLKRIKDVWLDKYITRTKSSPDMPVGHRINFSARMKSSMSAFLKDIEEKTNDPKRLNLWKENMLLFNAPAVVYLTLETGHTSWPVYDVGAFSMTLMLAAKNEGVDSVPAYEFVRFPEDVRIILDIPENEEVVMGIALGYPVEEDVLNRYRSTRLPVDEILTIRK